MKFALQDFISGGIDRMVMKRGDRKNGYTNARITFLPGVVYTADDELLIKYIKGEVGDVLQKSLATPDLIEELKAHNIKYVIKKCGNCSNSVPKVFYNPFKILEDD